jgi:hypothetical protein
VAIAFYVFHSPAEPPNGGTWLGYTLGGMGAAIIIFLLWFGVRKRQYHWTGNKQAEWVSAHVYMGCALVVIASLHCGFQFGWNVHTLTYVLMMLVVASGGFGLYAYLVFPAAITSIRNGHSRQGILKDVASADESCLTLASEMGEQIHHFILLMVEGTAIGGTAWQQLSGKSSSLSLSQFAQSWPAHFNTKQEAKRTYKSVRDHDGLGLATTLLRNHVVEADNAEQIGKAGELLGLLMRRDDLVQRLRGDVRYHALMKAWLYLHVPLSIALLAALVVHVVVVFLYW